MSVSISLFAGVGSQFFDNSGIPLAGGLLYTYAAGTTTPQETYTTSTGNIANANPIVLNSAGRTPNEIWLTSTLTYKFLLKTSVGTQIASYDNIGGAFDAASLAASTGSSLIGYIQGGAGSVAETVQSKLREGVSVKDFGADSTGVASSVAAFNAALLIGGTVYVPSGTYNLDGKVSLTTDNTTLLLAANVTLNLSGVAAVQVPFGNQIHVIANNCAVIGSGLSSVLQMTGASQANAIGILHKALFTVRDLTIDGDKTAVTPFLADTFGSAISLVCTNAGGATTDVRATIDNVYMKNFYHYGVNFYGEQANGIKIVNCNIESMGVAAQAESTGAGIVSTVYPSDITISNNVIKNCKWHGIFISQGGATSATYSITGNLIHQNGYTANHGSGIALLSEAQFGCRVGDELNNIAISGNVCTGNSRSGITVSLDTVGSINYVTITGNTLEGNTYAGIDFGCTDTSPSVISNVMVSGNQIAQNGSYQIISSPFVELVEGVNLPFTPFISGTTTAGTGTDATQVGSYVKNGYIVTFQVDLSWSAHTGTGNILVGGFPYTANNNPPTSAIWVWADGLSITGQATLNVTGAQTNGPLGVINNGAYSAVAMDTSVGLRITGSYFTN